MSDEIREAEDRGRMQADITALKEHSAKVNGSLDGIYARLGNIERSNASAYAELKASIAAAAAEKRGVLTLQNRQIALMAAIAAVLAAVGTILYLVVQSVH